MAIVPIKNLIENRSWNTPLSKIETPYLQAVNPMPSTSGLITSQHLSWLWTELMSVYGPLFVNKNGARPNSTWFDTLKDLTPKALESGMERLKQLSMGDKFTDFPPNCLQFRALCLAFYEDLHLPSTIDAYREVRGRMYMNTIHYSHPVIKLTAQRLSIEFLDIEDVGKAYAIFKEAYESVCFLVKQGHPLPQMPERTLMIRPQTRKIGAEQLAKMKRLLGVG